MCIFSAQRWSCGHQYTHQTTFCGNIFCPFAGSKWYHPPKVAFPCPGCVTSGTLSSFVDSTRSSNTSFTQDVKSGYRELIRGIFRTIERIEDHYRARGISYAFIPHAVRHNMGETEPEARYRMPEYLFPHLRSAHEREFLTFPKSLRVFVPELPECQRFLDAMKTLSDNLSLAENRLVLRGVAHTHENVMTAVYKSMRVFRRAHDRLIAVTTSLAQAEDIMRHIYLQHNLFGRYTINDPRSAEYLQLCKWVGMLPETAKALASGMTMAQIVRLTYNYQFNFGTGPPVHRQRLPSSWFEDEDTRGGENNAILESPPEIIDQGMVWFRPTIAYWAQIDGDAGDAAERTPA